MTGGCTTAVKVMSANYEMAGGVVRLQVYQYRGTLAEDGYEDSGLARKMADGPKAFFRIYGGEPTDEQVRPYRWIGIIANGAYWESGTFFGNAPTGPGGALVNDEVPLLREGDWVDAYVPKGFDWKNRRAVTVVKLVCKVEDKECQKREGKKPKGQLIAATFDESQLSITPHYDMEGHWLPGKKPVRP